MTWLRKLWAKLTCEWYDKDIQDGEIIIRCLVKHHCNRDYQDTECPGKYMPGCPLRRGE